jgi:hypothetical protein
MGPSVRTLLTSFLIAVVAPVGMAILDLDPPAFAKNGGGNGGGHGGGNGGGHGNSNSGNHGNANGHAKTSDSDTAADGDSDTASVADTKSHKSKAGLTGEDSLSPSALGKLNGVLHASPTAIAHASINSPIGTARAFGEALAGFLGAATTDDTTDETTDDTTGDETTTDETQPGIDQLGAMMANMTNKPVTAEQVEAVAAKLGIETAPDEATDDSTTDDAATGDDTTGDDTIGDETTSDETTGDDTTGDEAAGDEPADQPEAPKLDQATAEAIAEKANEIHGFTDGTDTTDDTDGDTADAGDDADSDSTDETATD